MALLRPDLMLNSVLDITPQLCEKYGLKALLLDVDNTLAIYHTDYPINGVAEWIDCMQAAGIKLHILSNAKPRRLVRFASRVGLPYSYMSLKPLPFKTNCAVKSLGLCKSQTALVGDQLFTDIVGGNLAGLFTIWLNIIEPEEKLSFRIKRKIENRYRRKLR